MKYTKKLYIPYDFTDENNVYPDSDEKPLAESERHLRCIIRMLDILETHFADIVDVYVWSNMMLYYVKGDPHLFLKPDIFVSFGVGKHERLVYQIWEEGKPPDFIMEFASKSTYENDLGHKKDIYAAIGVMEYFLYDPFRTCLPNPLMGYRLVDDVYIEIPQLEDGRIKSQTLNLDFVLQEKDVNVYEPATGKWLKTSVDMEVDARRKAETELEELREKLKHIETNTINPHNQKS